jgi:ketosteroid isomerase-like protein
MSEQNKKIALDFLEAMMRGDAAALTNVSRDVKFVTKGFGTASGTRGYDDLVGVFGIFPKLFPGGVNPKILGVTAEADRVAVEWEGNAKTFTGVPYTNQYVMLFTIRDGKIAQVNEYLCTKHADEAMMPAVAQLVG